MLLNNIQIKFAFYCLVISIIFQTECIISVNGEPESMHQLESHTSLYEAVLSDIVQRMQQALKQNSKIKPSDMRLMLFLMTEINKKKAEIKDREGEHYLEKDGTVLFK